MRIKVAFLDQDMSYLERIQNVLQNKYFSTIEVYLFTDSQTAVQTVVSNNIHVFLANEAFQLETSNIPSSCAFGYLTETKGMVSYKGKPSIFKYQKVENFQNEILGLFSDVIEGEISQEGNHQSKVLTFLSAGGGCGSTSCAIACALSYAKKGLRVFYLNLEKFNFGYYFKGEGSYGLSDVIYNIKSRKSNLTMKMKSAIRQDPSGVYYFNHCNTPMDIQELSSDDLEQLINELNAHGDFDCIVIDSDLTLDKEGLTVLKKSSNLIFVSDGSDISNQKFTYMYQAFLMLENQNQVRITDKIVIFYNRFNSRTGKILDESIAPSVGGSPRYEGSSQQIIEQLSNLAVFDSLLQVGGNGYGGK